MDLGLKGRRALITGSTAGIGYAIARGLAAEGAVVTITGRAEASVDAALTRLRADLPQAVADGVAADCATARGAEAVKGSDIHHEESHRPEPGEPGVPDESESPAPETPIEPPSERTDSAPGEPATENARGLNGNRED